MAIQVEAEESPKQQQDGGRRTEESIVMAATTTRQSSSLIADQVQVMVDQEASYSYQRFLGRYPSSVKANKEPRFNIVWREKICEWTYNVADHFDLSREVVAVSLSLFDRYLATRDNRASGSSALLVSLTTLHIAMKLYATSLRITTRTLATLSRGQFTPQDIEQEERLVLSALHWKLHPPTPLSFCMQFLRLLPPSKRRADILELAAYQTQLAVCDPYFVSVPSSTTALAAVWNVLAEEEETSFLPMLLNSLERLVGILPYAKEVQQARERMENIMTLPLVVSDDDDDDQQHEMNTRFSPVSTADPTSHPCHRQRSFSPVALRNRD